MSDDEEQSQRPPLSPAWSPLEQEEIELPDVLPSIPSGMVTQITDVDALGASLEATQEPQTVDTELDESTRVAVQMNWKEMQLRDAAKTGDVHTLSKLLGEGINPDTRDSFQQTPLLIAAAKGHLAIMEILLKAKASVDAINAQGNNALTVALIDEHVDCAKLMMKAGSNPLVAAAALSNVLEGVKTEALDTLASASLLCAAPFPIKTCFLLSTAFTKLAQRQEERKEFYRRLRNNCRRCAVDLLSCCKDMWDVRRLLNDRTNLLGLAVKHDQRNFIAHPFTQEFLKEMWLGQFTAHYGSRIYVVLIKFFLFPILFPYYLFLYLIQTPRSLAFSALGDYLKLCHTPFVKFVGNMISFVGLIVLVIVVASQPSQAVPNSAEVVLAVWIVALWVQEIREMYQTPSHIYLSSSWNLIDMIVYLSWGCVLGLRVFLYIDRNDTVNNEGMLYAANQLFAFSGVLAGVRFLNVLEAHYLLGPLQVSIKRIVQDLLVFLSILIVFMFSFAIGLTKIHQSVENIPENEEVISMFGSFGQTMRTLFWSIFGLVELPSLAVSGDGAKTIQTLSELLYGVYMVLVFILLINLLIAMISNTYQRIVDNSDTVWKFARAQLIREFERYPSVPTPFNLLLEPIHWLLSCCCINLSSVPVPGAYSSTDDSEEDEQLNKLNKTLSEVLFKRRLESQQKRNGRGAHSSDIRTSSVSHLAPSSPSAVRKALSMWSDGGQSNPESAPASPDPVRKAVKPAVASSANTQSDQDRLTQMESQLQNLSSMVEKLLALQQKQSS
eukprot:m.90186 g.90186  ORF g.90186 m.90186 type:complete len:781 (-) comp12910_c1_seq1:133-2475(-)